MTWIVWVFALVLDIGHMIFNASTHNWSAVAGYFNATISVVMVLLIMCEDD